MRINLEELFKVRRSWQARGVRTAANESRHTRATHRDVYGPKYKAWRKSRNAMAKQSRRRNR